MLPCGVDRVRLKCGFLILTVHSREKSEYTFIALDLGESILSRIEPALSLCCFSFFDQLLLALTHERNDRALHAGEYLRRAQEANVWIQYATVEAREK